METNQNEIPQIKLVYINKNSSNFKIKSSREAYIKFLEHYPRDSIQLREEFRVMFLSHNNRVLGIMLASTGSVCATVVDVRHILVTGLLANATGIIVSHNHPSGELKPSQSDKKITRQIVDGAKLLSLRMLDHIILSSEGYYSFADDGILENDIAIDSMEYHLDWPIEKLLCSKQ